MFFSQNQFIHHILSSRKFYSFPKLKIMKISLSILWDFLFVQALVDLREYSQCQFYCKWKQIKTIEVKLNKVITMKTPNNNQTGTSNKVFFLQTLRYPTASPVSTPTRRSLCWQLWSPWWWWWWWWATCWSSSPSPQSTASILSRTGSSLPWPLLT